MKKLLVIIAVLQLYACASPSPYEPADGARDFGYTESRLTDNRYRVTFKGNTRTSSDEVKDMALLRAAEITLLNDYDWFRVVTQETAEDTTYSPDRITTTGPVQRVYRDCGPLGCTTTIAPAYTGLDVVTVRETDHYTTSIEIVMGRGDLYDPTVAYDARELRNNLTRLY